jgi:hypothetical protein
MTPITPQELERRFAYHAPTPGKVVRHGAVRQACLDAARIVVANTPPSREQSLALTALEEAMFHAKSAIARHPEV